jgi:hypothetical protein
MINQQEWLRTRKNLLDEVKSQVLVRLGRPSRDLRRYSLGLETEFDGGWTASSFKQLRSSLRRARVVLGADFHAYSKAQRAHLRILRDHVSRRRVVLLMECLRPSDDVLANRFLRGQISESKFLEATDWNSSWGFPWEHYRPLFELARERGFEIRGVGAAGQVNLKRRDRDTARTIERVAGEIPDALIYLIIGEWHLSSGHLPRLLRARMGDPGEVLVLFQDSEKLYFRLARKRSEGKVEILRGRGDRYCLNVSPPWMKWQSYLMYLEHTYDRELDGEVGVDYSDHVAALVSLLERDLRTRIDKSAVQVFTASSKQSV